MAAQWLRVADYIAAVDWAGDWTCFQLRGHQGAVLAIAALGADVIATGGEDRALRFWSLSTGALLRTLSGHTGTIRAVVPLAACDGVVSAGDDGTLRSYGVGTGALWSVVATSAATPAGGTIKGYQPAVLCMAVLGAVVLATGTTSPTLLVWDTRQRARYPAVLPVPRGY